MKIYWDIQQGTPEWYQIRSGIPTASEFDQIVTPKQGKPSEARHKYACRIIAGRLLNWQADSLDKIEHIARGKEQEPFAAAQLEIVQNIETVPVGIITTEDGRWGASPDRVWGVRHGEQPATLPGTVEIKCPSVPVQFQYLLLGAEDAYRCQVQGQLLVAEADKAIFYTYNDRMPAYMVETGRDEDFLTKLRDGLERFSDELDALMEKAMSLGTYQAFHAIVPPLDAERARDALATGIENPQTWRL